MTIKQRLKNRPALYQSMLSVLNTLNYFNWRFNYAFPRYKLSETWRKRIDLVKQSEDNARITHVDDAGKIFPDHQIMHNGLKITLGSYYDYGNTVLLRDNKGVHEPQEEYVFQEVLKAMPEGACMLELGSYWAFYSMWFARDVKDAKCFMVEPDPHKMNFGKLNFRLNDLKGVFDLGFIGRATNRQSAIPFYTVDYLMEKHRLDFIHLLHSDIQGFEADMLSGASRALSEKKIGYIFISTHSNDLHAKCIEMLISFGYRIAAEANLDASFSWDGLIVAKNPAVPGPSEFLISRR